MTLTADELWLWIFRGKRELPMTETDTIAIAMSGGVDPSTVAGNLARETGVIACFAENRRRPQVMQRLRS